MLRVVIVGGGLAGMSAGIKLLESRPGTEAHLFLLGHHLGGKTSSYRDEDGYNIDHGFHALQAACHRYFALMERAGIDRETTLVKDRGTYFFDDPGILRGPGPATDPEGMRRAARQLEFFMKNEDLLFNDPDIEKYDDVSFTDWALELGMDPEMTETRGFRFARDALFNWPHEISAYINLKSLRMLERQPDYYFVNGTYGENLMRPIADHFERLGGTITRYHKLTEILHDEGRVTGLRFERPDFFFHDHGDAEWERSVRTLPGSRIVDGFDAVVVAIPMDNFRELNEGDAAFWAGFPGIENLRSVATLSWQLWTREKVLPVDACVNTLDEPLPMVIDYKDLLDHYREDDRFGSALQWVGQENGFEDRTDDEIKEIALRSFLQIPGAKDPRIGGIVHDSFRRNTSNHKRYLLTDPGTVRYRPRSKTHLENLFLAGDWIRNDIDVPTMEGSICSGYTAIGELLGGAPDATPKA